MVNEETKEVYYLHFLLIRKDWVLFLRRWGIRTS